MGEGVLNFAEHWLNSVELASIVFGLRNINRSEIATTGAEEVVQLKKGIIE